MLLDRFKKLKKPDPKAEEEFKNEIDKMGGLEKTDMPAMVISALLVILPVAALALIVICLLAWLLLM